MRVCKRKIVEGQCDGWRNRLRTEASRLVSRTALLGNDVCQELHLALGTAQGTDTALDELASTLVL